MKVILSVLMMISLSACMNMADFSDKQRHTPQTYPTYDPNCQRHIPTPRTPEGYPDMGSPEYQETHHRTHCK